MNDAPLRTGGPRITRLWLALLCAAAAPLAGAQSPSKPMPPDQALVLPELTPLPAASSASTPLRKRLLTPRTGSAVTNGISGDAGNSGYSGGNSNGINTGSDASRSSNGAAGTVAAPMGSKPLKPREPLKPVKP